MRFVFVGSGLGEDVVIGSSTLILFKPLCIREAVPFPNLFPTLATVEMPLTTAVTGLVTVFTTPDTLSPKSLAEEIHQYEQEIVSLEKSSVSL